MSRYDGTTLLNWRSLRPALNLLAPSAFAYDGDVHSATAKQQRADGPIKLEALAALLQFLELYTMSKGLVYDGTLPKRDLDLASRALDLIHQTPDLKHFYLAPVSNNKSEPMTELRNAAGEMEHLIENFEFTEADKPLAKTSDSDPEADFRTALEEVTQRLEGVSGDNEDEESERIAAQYYTDSAESLRGAKCIAALALGGTKRLRKVRQIYNDNPSQARRVSGSLINRFRMPYLRELSQAARAIYVPDAGLEPLSICEVATFLKFVMQILFEGNISTPHKIQGSLAGEMSECFTRGVRMPPLGMLLLLQSNAKNPLELLIEANNFRRGNRHLRSYMWTVDREARAKADKEFNVAVDNVRLEVFRKRLRELQNSHRANQYLLPSIGKIVRVAGGAGLGVLGGIMVGRHVGVPVEAGAYIGAAGGTALVEIVKEIAKSVTESMTEDSLINVGERLHTNGAPNNLDLCQYGSFRKLILDNVPFAQSLSEKVEAVFGRPLVM